jgi:hypothetical protein
VSSVATKVIEREIEKEDLENPENIQFNNEFK